MSRIKVSANPTDQAKSATKNDVLVMIEAGILLKLFQVNGGEYDEITVFVINRGGQQLVKAMWPHRGEKRHTISSPIWPCVSSHVARVGFDIKQSLGSSSYYNCPVVTET